MKLPESKQGTIRYRAILVSLTNAANLLIQITKPCPGFGATVEALGFRMTKTPMSPGAVLEAIWGKAA